MVIVTSLAYPPESAKEIAKRFLDAPAVPDFMKRRGPYVSANKEDGIATLSFYELDRARLADGLEFVAKFETTFYGVPGFKYKIEPHFEVNEALSMIGMG